ncbi:MAG: hypothetical protein LCI00_00010 [Chloroflexi bacterium]|nr:hypothetical protein [Chloroflexota bacterium]MCC6893167.1 hypothetical protein [Anaerolineae bacterium]
MLYRFITLFVILFMTFSVSKASEEQSQKWYYAWRDSTQELLAYTADGQVNTLLTGHRVNNLWQEEGETAIALVIDETHYSFFKLTPTEAIPIDAEFDNHIDPYNVNFGGRFYTGSYFLISSSQQPEKVLVDLNKLQAKVLNHRRSHDFVLSENRELIRFFSDVGEDGKSQLELWEYKLDTGDERLIYRQDNNSSMLSCSSYRYGDQWLCHQEMDTVDGNILRYFLINEDGTTTKIIDDQQYQLRWIVYSSDNDDLIIFDKLCMVQCSVEVYPRGELQPKVYPIDSKYLPLQEKFGFIGFWVISNGLLFSDSAKVFRVKSDGTFKELGENICCHDVGTWSPDGKWLVLWSDDFEKTRVWNLDEDKLEFEYVNSEMVSLVEYFEGGFVLTEGCSSTQVYLYSTKEPMQFMGDPCTFIFRILSDDTFLIDDSLNNGDLDEGIYHYDPMTDTYTLLIADAHIGTGR